MNQAEAMMNYLNTSLREGVLDEEAQQIEDKAAEHIETACRRLFGHTVIYRKAILQDEERSTLAENMSKAADQLTEANTKFRTAIYRLNKSNHAQKVMNKGVER